MNYHEIKRQKGREMRVKVAYMRIAYGLVLKQIAQRLGIKEKTAEYYWATAQRVIRGQSIKEH